MKIYSLFYIPSKQITFLSSKRSHPERPRKSLKIHKVYLNYKTELKTRCALGIVSGGLASGARKNAAHVHFNYRYLFR